MIAAPIQPTVAPENDTQAPTTAMDTLSEVSARTFVVRWRAQDNGAIDRYIVWVRINDGGWTPWVETQRTEGIYTGTPGNSYSFAVWAVDRAGNWSPNTDLQPQTQTRVE
ncbi:MAG: fibronectin type III domain-containing protein [Anaerolineae bacterium]|nr:fibronectin type III domain-containing protein [Anaerolineae bacterium]